MEGTKFLVHAIIHLMLWADIAIADKLLSLRYLPDGISQACANALTADTDCNQIVSTLEGGKYYSQKRLKSICIDACTSSLASYHNNVVSSCALDTWEGPGDVEQPVAFMSELIRYHYNFTCIKDEGRFCNNVAAAFVAAAHPKEDPSDLPAGGDFGDHDTNDPCDICLLKNLAFQAGSPYYGGPSLRNQSVYEEKTKSCGIKTAPLTTTTNSLAP